MKNKKIIEFFIVLIAICLLLNQVEAFNETNISTIDTLNYVTSDPIDIKSDQDFIDLGFSGSGTKENPYIIENYEINGTIAEDGISVQDTTKYFIIRGCKITGAYLGIAIDNVTAETALIINNYIYLNNDNGIDLFETSGHRIENNTLNENKMAIRLDECSDLTIIDNTCIKQRGLGLLAFNCDNLTLTGNTIVYSSYEAIYFETTTNSTVYMNLFQLNDEFGAGTTARGNDNVFYHNDFIDNNQDPSVPAGASQGEDKGENNLWYHSTLLEGNYWSDWSGEGAYQIDGEADNSDLYPLSAPISGLVYEVPEDPTETDPTDEETPYSLFFILALLSTAFVLIKRRNRN